jgi:hypothetical protein
MKLIAHRGNIDGPNPLEENRPEYIEAAISKDMMWRLIFVMIPLIRHFIWVTTNLNTPQVGFGLGKYIHHLWVHCKNIEALYEFAHGTSGFNYFWHQEDDFTLTSKNYIWTYPGKSYTYKFI